METDPLAKWWQRYGSSRMAFMTSVHVIAEALAEIVPQLNERQRSAVFAAIERAYARAEEEQVERNAA